MDPSVVDQYELLDMLVEIEKTLPDSLEDVVFPGMLHFSPMPANLSDPLVGQVVCLRYPSSSTTGGTARPYNDICALPGTKLLVHTSSFKHPTLKLTPKLKHTP